MMNRAFYFVFNFKSQMEVPAKGRCDYFVAIS